MKSTSYYIFYIIIMVLSNCALGESAQKPLVDSKEPARRGYLKEVSLQIAVDEFNQRLKNNSAKVNLKPLGKEEVLDAVKKGMHSSAYSKSSKTILDKIAKTEILPIGAYLNFAYSEPEGKNFYSFSIFLVWGRETNPPEEKVWYKPDNPDDLGLTIRQQRPEKLLVDSINPERRGYLKEVSLQNAVDEFNQRWQRNPLKIKFPPLSQEEVLAAIQKTNSSKYSPSSKKVLENIMRTKILPVGSYLYVSFKNPDYYERDKNGNYIVCRIALIWGGEVNPPEEKVWYKPDNPDDLGLNIRLQTTKFKPKRE